MKTNKKIIPLILATLLLAGCGGDKTNPTDNEPKVPDTEEHQEDDGQKTLDDEESQDDEEEHQDPVETKETAFAKMKSMFQEYKNYKGSFTFATHESVGGNLGGSNKVELNDHFEITSLLTYNGETREIASKFSNEFLSYNKDGSIRNIRYEDGVYKDYLEKDTGYECYYEAESYGCDTEDTDTLESVKKAAIEDPDYDHTRYVGDPYLEERAWYELDNVNHLDCPSECIGLLNGILCADTLSEVIDEQNKVNENSSTVLNIDVSFDGGVYKLIESETNETYEETSSITFVFKNNKFDSFELLLETTGEYASYSLTTGQATYSFDSDFFDSIVPAIPYEDYIRSNDIHYLYFNGNYKNARMNFRCDLTNGFEEAKTITSYATDCYRVDFYVDEALTEPIDLSGFKTAKELEDYIDNNLFYFDIIQIKTDCVISVESITDSYLLSDYHYDDECTGSIICYDNVTEKALTVSSKYTKTVVNGEEKTDNYTIYSDKINFIEKYYRLSICYLRELPYIADFA